MGRPPDTSAATSQYFTLPGLFHMESMEWRVEADGFHGMADGFHIIPWNFQIIPWNFQMDSILFKSDLMPPQNSIQNSYVNIDIVLIIVT